MFHIIRFEAFLHIPNFFYRSVGIDLWGTQGGRIHQLLFYFSFTNMNMWLLSEITYVVIQLNENFVRATMTLSYAGFVFVGTIKLYYMWRKKQELKRYLTLMNAIFPRTEQLQRTMNLRRHLRQSSIAMSCFTFIFMVLIWTYNLYPWMQRLIYDRWLHVRTIPKALPYESYLPWKWQGHWSFYVCYTLQSIAGYHSAAGQIAADLVLCVMATQTIMHYEYVAQRIADYQPKYRAAQQRQVERVSERRSNGISQWKAERDAYCADMQGLSEIIAYHANVLSLSELMNEVFGVPLLVNFMTSCFVICFVGFQMTMDAEPEYLVKLSLFLFTSLIQIYMICHYGQVLMDTSVNIAQAVFNQDWTNAHFRCQRLLVLVAARAQKPAMLQATSFVRISRGTMTDIMQISYKFFTLIRTMYSN